MPKYSEIKRFTKTANYSVSISWKHFPKHYFESITKENLNVDPEFQREYVWNLKQKQRYVEFILRGGNTGKDIYCNCPNWNKVKNITSYVLVDGKQRINAVLGYLNNEFKIFNKYYHKDFEDNLHILIASFTWHVNDLQTYKEVLQWYIDLNQGGTIHSNSEIEKVKSLLKKKVDFENLSNQDIINNSDLDKDIFSKFKDK